MDLARLIPSGSTEEPHSQRLSFCASSNASALGVPVRESPSGGSQDHVQTRPRARTTQGVPLLAVSNKGGEVLTIAS